MSSTPTGTDAPVATRPLPVPDDRSAPFWQAAARHELALARCARCASLVLAAGDVCPQCFSTEPEFSFEAVSGAGVLRSWTVVRQSFLPGLSADTPFVLADVELDAQRELRMIGRLVDGPDVPLRAGDRVRLEFEDLAEGIAVPAFALDRDSR